MSRALGAARYIPGDLTSLRGQSRSNRAGLNVGDVFGVDTHTVKAAIEAAVRDHVLMELWRQPYTYGGGPRYLHRRSCVVQEPKGHNRLWVVSYWWHTNRDFTWYAAGRNTGGKPYTWAGWRPVYGPHQWYRCGGRWLLLPEPDDNVPVLWGDFWGNKVQSSQWA